MTILIALAWMLAGFIFACAVVYAALVFAMWIIGRLPDVGDYG